MLKYKYLDRDITYSCMYLNVFLNNIIKKKLVERANLGDGSLLSGDCIEKQIRC